MSELVVWHGSERVGRLSDDGERMHFTYDAMWNRDGFPISVSLPLDDARHEATFFSNLLPEGALREAICGRLRISYDNDFALLAAIGGECAGALSLFEPSRPPPTPDEWVYDAIADRRLQRLVSSDIPLLAGGAVTRLSLAGAQDKIPIALLDGTVHLPGGNAPSTHILKLASRRFAHLPINEAFALGFARRIGLDVAPCEVFKRTDPPCLLVERYDRRRSEDPWPAIRLHQEDMCQALGFPPSKKYEHEGGPSFARIVQLVQGNVTRPLLDVPRLLRWQAFNVIVGNSDAHAKNLALVHSDGEVRLAPFYDIVATREYDGLDGDLAMNIGGRRNPDELQRAHWVALAREVEIAERVVLDLVNGVVEESLGAIDAWTKEFRELHSNPPVASTLPKAIRKRARGAAKRWA